MHPNLPVQARLAVAIALAPAEGAASIPEDIQWMPPGRHTITPLVNGKPKTLTLQVDEDLARAMAGYVRELRQAAAAGQGDVPYIDFNHEDREAAAEVIDLYWAGDDPKTGGIRAKIAWSSAGRAALEGRTFRRFSPQWAIDPQTGQPAGLGPNLGGLVNRAAFQTIQPVVAKRGDISTETNTMTDQEKQELTQLIQAATAPLVDRIAALEGRTPDAAQVTALDARVKNLESANGAVARAAARARVDAAIQSGRLPAQAKDQHERWESLIVADPKNAELLEALPENPALRAQFRTGSAAQGGAGSPADFPGLVKAKLAGGAKSKLEAVQAAMAEKPELYQAWVEAGGSAHFN